jgi:hypothetical protein
MFPPTMKRTLIAACVLATALLVAGCNTVDSRIEKRRAAFEQLAPEVQQRIREGKIALGDSPDAVWIALGRPDEVRRRETREGTDEVWIYSRAHIVNEGFTTIGYNRQVLRDSKGRIVAITLDPVYAHSNRIEVEPVLRLVFAKGVITEIEETKRN